MVKTGAGVQKRRLRTHLKQGVLWNGKWYGMEGEFGMEYGRCSEWTGMEDLKNEMDDRVPY